MASMNPFAKSTPNSAEPGAAAKVTDSIASTASGARNQLGTMGTTAKSALGKTTNAVAGVFGRQSGGAEETTLADPLSLTSKPDSIGPEVFVANGQLWESTGDFKKAMESYTKALESEENNAPALTSIARLHFRQGNHKLASDFFQKAITQSPEDAGLHNDLGLTLSKLGDHAGATRSLEKALELAPGTSRYANNLASVQFEAGQAASAYQVLSTNNKPAVAHFNMAYLHFKNGQMGEARGHLGEALRFEPQASEDAAVKRAVDRSRDMLAQIDASMAPIAQAAPQATIAGVPYLGGKPQAASIQQTSQSGSSTSSVAPAAPMAPAMNAIKPQAAAPSLPRAAAPSLPKAEALVPTMPSLSLPAAIDSQPAASKPTRPMPVRPTEAKADSSSPSIPFALPGGFPGLEAK